jgi:hypothetical protein
MTFLIIVAVIAVCWCIALEVRFHNLKDVAAESKTLANEAVATARNAINRKKS